MKKTEYRKIKSLPSWDRPREKLLKLGPNTLSESELLAIILETGTRNTSALELANEILTRFKSINHLFKVSIEELCTVQGVGVAKAVKIKAALELADKCLTRKLLATSKIEGPEDVYHLLKFRLQNENRECFVVVLVNTKNHLLKVETISVGSLDATIVHPREVFRLAVQMSSSGVILVHNHPSGDPEPSKNDIELTDKLLDAGKLLGIRVLDHVIVGHRGFFSFSNEQLL
ncbi:RadC family protein [Natranaerobius trueperi]|uniref:MPN domain-containing protein n=1 Tax=Natranaerobius trueperi TaxID=759412 RepID=A0A226BY31_9FIRM|nr:DNA repair protein RadC [Natranaerobius trueperi]OWZ83916.1 hypothetical protein CDO51_05885 [Natranaerobius trueperi]